MSTSIRAAVITVSDACSRGEREDDSGAALVELLKASAAEVVETGILSDDLEPLVQRLEKIARRGDINLIITTGGTGLGPRDNTPEATLRVIEREAPGIAEAIRAESLKVTPMAMISRGVAGVASETLIINLPGSPKAVRESFAVIQPVLAHAVDLLAGNTRH
ncbi:MAG TPA: MogA/MoaB family molybdenum cofactor biosynthesis protein [Pyrinomonadaceae bacterium]|nr:MogA/MoaB family molybdenum cofactor biosynthesis protein [Pyrinomonadaceae bacterium]